MGTVISDIASDAVFVLIICQLLYHILRKILANPQKTIKDWATSWSPGVGLLCYGFIIMAVFHGEYKIDFGVLLAFIGILFLLGKIIAKIIGSIVSHFRHRSPAAAHAAAPGPTPASSSVASSPGESGT